ncbi:hypothetical protein INS49_012112 [Diaporthe citri]|uniref:uncharacterized protein n=1 Tax=Diaporthe citri TaxID=83186 RepID=UPI001C7ED605|nr:uncharacterized protein INS49_012112 [Diaporthe citri]KAG6358594.1 hypothetical protein INS49_012112 [Diaporthe citri]
MPRPKVPAVSRQTIRSAFEDLENVITPQDSRDYHDYSLERVRKEALNIENQLASRGWLRNMRRLKPLFTGLEHYSKVVDTLCNGTPYLPWIWAPITLILRIASEHIESFDSLIGAYGRIGSSLQRFEVLRKSFLGDPRFHEATAAFYADILEFHKHAYKFVRRSGWKLLFATSWGRFQRRFNHILEDMKNHEDLIDRLVNAIDISEARQMRQDLLSWREQKLQEMSDEDEKQSAQEFRAIQSWLRMNECDQLAIFESTAGQGNRYPGTCQWILNNTKINSWLQESPQTPILWLSGIAGSGKSVISSQLVNFITSRNGIVLHHFCTNASVMSSEYDQVLKSLLEQLLRHDGDLTTNVYHEYVLKKQVAAVAILEQLLQTLLNTSAEDPRQRGYIWIVVDGVDELRDHSPNSQARLLNFIKQIVSKTNASENATCKALISARPSTTISHVLRQKPTVSLTEEKKSLALAIQEYALQRLGSLGNRFEQLGLSALEIESFGQQISHKSDGMFLYARLVLDFISSNIFVRGDELRNAVNQLPRELSSLEHVRKEHDTATPPKPLRRVKSTINRGERRQAPMAPIFDAPVTANGGSVPYPSSAEDQNGAPLQYYQVQRMFGEQEDKSAITAKEEQDEWSKSVPENRSQVQMDKAAARMQAQKERLSAVQQRERQMLAQGMYGTNVPGGNQTMNNMQIDPTHTAQSKTMKQEPALGHLPKYDPEQKQLTDADKQRIQALAQILMQEASDAQKQQMMQNLRLPPQRLAQMRAEGKNPLAMLFQQEATKSFSGMTGGTALESLDKGASLSTGLKSGVVRMIYFGTFLVPEGFRTSPRGTRDNMVPEMKTDLETGVIIVAAEYAKEVFYQDVDYKSVAGLLLSE